MPRASSRSDPDETQQLFRRYAQSGDPELRQVLIARHTYLAQSVARKFMGLGESPEDLVQEGTMGLIAAVDMYDLDRGVQFTTYATHLIEGHIRHYLRDRGKLMRSPAWIQERLTKISKATDALTQELGRAPTTAEMAQRVGIPEAGVTSALKAQERTRITSLDAAPSPDDDGPGPISAEKLLLQGSEPSQLPVEDRIFLHQAMDRLKAIERKVVYHFFYQDLNLTEIARKLGISVNYASYLLRGALRSLREAFETQAKATQLLTEPPPVVRPSAQGPAPSASLGTGPSQSPAARPLQGIGALNLPDQAYLRDRLEQEVARSQRYPQAFALLLVDPDATDALAALTPDRQSDLARHIARLLRHSVRQVDLVARTGAVRFGLLLPHTGVQAAVLGERLRNLIASSTPPAGLEPITVSISMAIFPNDAATAEALFQRAEAALAQASAAGGNRAVRAQVGGRRAHSPALAC